MQLFFFSSRLCIVEAFPITSRQHLTCLSVDASTTNVRAPFRLHLYASSSFLFNVRERKILQKKNTQLRNNTRRTGGQKAMFTAVAGTQSFQFATMVLA
mmetsp:Transcript_11485/g.16858  ORF Transcript_11485/g.16858 Transcript_11485/m.16858 type:complete len:99 (+) Transcript_11485:349-645(+)